MQSALSTSLKVKVPRLYTDGSGTFVPKDRHRIINWGLSVAPDKLRNGVFINKPELVSIAANKLLTFNKLSENPAIHLPLYTSSMESAQAWIDDGKVVVCRTKLNGHSGAGIILAARTEDLVVNCPLYVQYIKKAREFRVHVAFGKVIDIQAKRKRTDYDGEVDYAIRNHHTGWVYCRENIEEPDDLQQQAIDAVLTLGLDFGAVDIIYNKHLNTSYILEINTAPGLQGETIEKYSNAFTEYFKHA